MDDLIHVLVALDYNDEWLAKMREVSPRLQVVKAYPEVPESAWENLRRRAPRRELRHRSGRQRHLQQWI